MKVYQVYTSTYMGDFIVATFSSLEEANKLKEAYNSLTTTSRMDRANVTSFELKDTFRPEDYRFLDTNISG